VVGSRFGAGYDRGMPNTSRVRRAARRLSSAGRSLPDFLVVGGVRCGTSSFFNWIATHPDVRGASRKEVHFFDYNYDRGAGWYRSFFPGRTAHGVSFEASPSYLAHPSASTRAHDLVPDARIIAILRDPVDRAWSHYRFRRASGHEIRTFAAAMGDELSVDDAGPAGGFSAERTVPYLVGGRYADQLPVWIDAFGNDRVLVIDATAMFERPTEVQAEVQNFIGVSHLDIPLERLNLSPPEPLDEQTKSELQDYFEPHNVRLADLVEAPIGWLAPRGIKER